MYSKKIIVWPVIISVIGHVALISASSMIDLRDNVKAVEIFTLDFKEPAAEQPPKKEEIKELKDQPESKITKEVSNTAIGNEKEDTVNLGSSDVRYVEYLIKIKRKILQIWEYPQKAYENNEEGIVVVKISLDAQGNLIGTKLVSSSGSVMLDEGALSIVKTAAPFDPLPNSYDLARLNIVASFHYKLVE